MIDYKTEFIKIFTDNIKREGANALLDYLTNHSDFFVAPASGRRHSAFEGGLCFHSLNTYHRYKKNIIKEYGEKYFEVISDESIAIIALLHDLCKVNTYNVDYRNQKVDGQWIQVPYYAYNNSLPYGHGEKSVYIISGYMRLTREEAMAINWHMGGFDPRNQGSSDMADAFNRYPTAVLFHISDMEAVYLDESIK
ncbi:MAG: hydrolase [Clostridiales bacterium]|nr:hydrolase [Clostridiales bacterium]